MMYTVIVGNVGLVHSGYDRTEANLEYDEYVRQSGRGYGRAAGEPVTMFADGEPVREFTPTGSAGINNTIEATRKEQP